MGCGNSSSAETSHRDVPEMGASKYTIPCTEDQELYDEVDQLQEESLAGPSITEGGAVGKSISMKLKTIEAKLRHGINDDPNQFDPGKAPPFTEKERARCNDYVIKQLVDSIENVGEEIHASILAAVCSDGTTTQNNNQSESLNTPKGRGGGGGRIAGTLLSSGGGLGGNDAIIGDTASGTSSRGSSSNNLLVSPQKQQQFSSNNTNRQALDTFSASGQQHVGNGKLLGDSIAAESERQKNALKVAEVKLNTRILKENTRLVESLLRIIHAHNSGEEYDEKPGLKLKDRREVETDFQEDGNPITPSTTTQEPESTAGLRPVPSFVDDASDMARSPIHNEAAASPLRSSAPNNTQQHIVVIPTQQSTSGSFLRPESETVSQCDAYLASDASSLVQAPSGYNTALNTPNNKSGPLGLPVSSGGGGGLEYVSSPFSAPPGPGSAFVAGGSAPIHHHSIRGGNSSSGSSGGAAGMEQHRHQQEHCTHPNEVVESSENVRKSPPPPPIITRHQLEAEQHSTLHREEEADASPEPPMICSPTAVAGISQQQKGNPTPSTNAPKREEEVKGRKVGDSCSAGRDARTQWFDCGYELGYEEEQASFLSTATMGKWVRICKMQAEGFSIGAPPGGGADSPRQQNNTGINDSNKRSSGILSYPNRRVSHGGGGGLITDEGSMSSQRSANSLRLLGQQQQQQQQLSPLLPLFGTSGSPSNNNRAGAENPFTKSEITREFITLLQDGDSTPIQVIPQYEIYGKLVVGRGLRVGMDILPRCSNYYSACGKLLFSWMKKQLDSARDRSTFVPAHRVASSNAANASSSGDNNSFAAAQPGPLQQSPGSVGNFFAEEPMNISGGNGPPSSSAVSPPAVQGGGRGGRESGSNSNVGGTATPPLPDISRILVGADRMSADSNNNVNSNSTTTLSSVKLNNSSTTANTSTSTTTVVTTIGVKRSSDSTTAAPLEDDPKSHRPTLAIFSNFILAFTPPSTVVKIVQNAVNSSLQQQSGK